MTATCRLVGRRLVEAEQAGETRAEYGRESVDRLSADLTERFGRGFDRSSLFQMHAFFLARRHIVQTASGQSSVPHCVLDLGRVAFVALLVQARKSAARNNLVVVPRSSRILLLSRENPHE